MPIVQPVGSAGHLRCTCAGAGAWCSVCGGAHSNLPLGGGGSPQLVAFASCYTHYGHYGGSTITASHCRRAMCWTTWWHWQPRWVVLRVVPRDAPCSHPTPPLLFHRMRTCPYPVQGCPAGSIMQLASLRSTRLPAVRPAASGPPHTHTPALLPYLVLTACWHMSGVGVPAGAPCRWAASRTMRVCR